MGGNAFHTLLPDATFPRIPPAAYHSVKSRLMPLVQQFYAQVAVPREAPEKPDFGDLDFVVCEPLDGRPAGDLGAALGATQSILMDRGICNFAIPVKSLDCLSALLSTDENAFFQVDVQMCANMQEWECYVSYSSYGDLGMILGSIARSLQLSLGHSGLRVSSSFTYHVCMRVHYCLQLASPLPTAPPLAFRLSSSFPQILTFFELSIDQWTEGFATQLEIFEWLASSPFFDVQRLSPSRGSDTAPSSAKYRVRDARPMYQHFLEFVRLDESIRRYSRPRITPQTALDMALVHFGRRALYDILLHFAEVKKHVRSTFTGKLVEEWTGLKGMSVRLVMDEVRRKLGGTGLVSVDVEVDKNIERGHVTLAIWENALFGMSLDAIQQLVVETKEEMNHAGKLEFDWQEAKRLRAERKAVVEKTIVEKT